MQDFTSTFGNSAANALPANRAQFIRKTYMLLAIAIAAFIGVEAFLFSTPLGDMIAYGILGTGGLGWLAVLGLFMLVSYIANNWAVSTTSTAQQYLGLGIYIVAEAIIFVPLLFIASRYSADQLVILKAGIVTIGLFLGITATVFMTRSDFSFLAPILTIGGFAALGIYRRELVVRLYARQCFRVPDGRVCRNGDPISDVECAAPVQDRPARCGRTGTFCERRTFVLVHFENIFLAQIVLVSGGDWMKKLLFILGIISAFAVSAFQPGDVANAAADDTEGRRHGA